LRAFGSRGSGHSARRFRAWRLEVSKAPGSGFGGRGRSQVPKVGSGCLQVPKLRSRPVSASGLGSWGNGGLIDVEVSCPEGLEAGRTLVFSSSPFSGSGMEAGGMLVLASRPFSGSGIEAAGMLVFSSGRLWRFHKPTGPSRPYWPYRLS
jgi:hypothetical protein